MPRSVTTLLIATFALLMILAPVDRASAQMEPLGIETTLVWDAGAAHPGGTIRGALHVQIEEHWHVHSNTPLEEGLIATVLTVTAPEGFTVTKIVYPAHVLITPDFQPDPLAVLENDFVIGIELAIDEAVAHGTHEIKTSLRYQGCDDTTCKPPDDRETIAELIIVAAGTPIEPIDSDHFDRIDFGKATAGPVATEDGAETAVAPGEDCDVMAELADFELLATAGGYLNVEDFLQFVGEAEGTVAKKKGMFEGKGMLAIMALIVIGGVLLNLTPCVLPLIPINLAILGAGAQSGSRLRGFALGGTYGLAMALVYGVLGLVVILTASSFGAINSTVWFNIAIAVLFVFLALAMFDVIVIDFTKYQGKLDVTSKAKQGTFLLAFFMGGVTALLAGACVAPVVIQVIVYASDMYTKAGEAHNTFNRIIALFLPFLLGVGLALPWPILGGGISVLPKPGTWMVRVKQAMGVFILIFAGYYGYLAYEIIRGPGDEASTICQDLARAKEENKPILIDMWATWCKNCLAMEETTFVDEEVVERLEDYIIIKYQAENTSISPAVDMLELFNGQGLPTYAILKPIQADAAD